VMSAATPEKTKKTVPGAPKARNNQGLIKIFYGFLLLSMMFISLPAFVFSLIGTLPSVAAWVWDRRPSKSAAYTVIIMNMAGLIPVILEVLPLGQNINSGMPALESMENWLQIYGAAAFGWGILFALPTLIRGFILRGIESDIAKNHKKQEELVQAWGRRLVTADGHDEKVPDKN